MPLRLVITTYHKLTPGQRAEAELDRGELKIGRSASNDWVLPDPERLISSQHCVIQYRNGSYYITDTSTNGVILQSRGACLRRGNSERLEDGEVLKLGDYEVGVHIEDACVTPPPSQASVNSLDSFEALMGRSAQAQAIPASPTDLVAMASGLDSPLDTKSELFNFLAPAVSHAPPLPDHVPAQLHNFLPPQTLLEDSTEASAAASIIPADWDPFGVSGGQQSGEIHDALADSLQEPRFESVAQQQATPPAVSVSQALDKSPALQPLTSMQSAPLTSLLGSAEQSERACDGELLEAFLRGAGLPQLRLDRTAAVVQMEAVGRSYRLMVEGLIDVLRARASLKGEFRMAQTMIQPVQNNPLKFAPNVDEALLLLLRPDNQTFMAPDQAVGESFDDLRAHQLALMAGVQAAIKYLLARFEPNELEGRLNRPSGLSTLLPKGRRAHYWELFTELYETVSQEAEEGFQELFGREFSRAYEQHISRLRGR